MKKYLLTFVILCGTSMFLAAQPAKDKADLERERKEIQDELKQMQDIYNSVKGQTKQSLSQLNMVKRKMNLQERYISSISKELRLIDDDIYRSSLEIFRLRRQLDTLKSEYARTIVYAYKNRSSFNYVNFIFSATSFNDAARRVSYLKSYRAYREKQVVNINETQELIARRQVQQQERKVQKNETLHSQTKERGELAEQRKEKDAVVSKLKSQEKDLQKEISSKKKRDKDLQNAIAATIRREIEAAKKVETARIEAVKKAVAEKNSASAVNPTIKPTAPVNKPAERPESYLELNAKDVALGADFSENRGKLPWPVDKGFVKVPFGTYTIDGTKLRGDNPGLTIGTEKGSSVKAVFEGVVSAVHNYGDGAAIVIRHGKYFTSYSNLAGVSVSKGSAVKRGQVIGRAGEADDNVGGQVDFMLLVEANNVNPAPWLSRH
ncbi:MAG: peptidoglycan DD-metalloendopeptidase family protein [Chitinophagaceae bacterium]